MALKKRNFSTHLFRYKRRFVVSISIFSGFVFILLWILIFGVSSAIKTLDKIREVIETNFLNSDEILQFKNANISMVKPKGDQNYLIEAQIKENVSKKISLRGNFNYLMKDLEADVFLIPKNSSKENWIEKYYIVATFVGLTDNTVILEKDIEAHFISRINKKLNGTVAFIDKIIFYIKENVAKGNKIFIKNPTSTFKADKFEIMLEKDLAKFSQNVLYDTPDYKIQSNALEATFIKGEVQSLVFKQNVRFYEKGENKTIALGDVATFDIPKSEITMDGKVLIQTKKNNMQIKADSFHYNEKTKKGSFKNKKIENRESKIEIELDV
jgi:lipopolysaccharide export system protein LptA